MAHGMQTLQVSRMKEEVPLPAPPADHPPAFVLGAEHDMLVDVPAIEETAALYGVAPVILENCAHDVMLVRLRLYNLAGCALQGGQIVQCPMLVTDKLSWLGFAWCAGCQVAGSRRSSADMAGHALRHASSIGRVARLVFVGFLKDIALLQAQYSVQIAHRVFSALPEVTTLTLTNPYNLHTLLQVQVLPATCAPSCPSAGLPSRFILWPPGNHSGSRPPDPPLPSASTTVRISQLSYLHARHPPW